MASINAEDLILAHNLKTERQAIPVNITAAVNDSRIDPEDFLDDGTTQLETMLKNDCLEAKRAFVEANQDELKAKKDFERVCEGVIAGCFQ